MAAKKINNPWWTERWWKCVTKGGNSARMARGKTLARGGAVLGVEITKGQIRARVQGSRRHPYQVELFVKQFLPGDWALVVEEVSQQAGICAQLLNGELPSELERMVASLELALFPPTTMDIPGNCSCPDWENPCKHIAAVLYSCGQQFAVQPFLLLELRGMNQEEFLAALRKRRAAIVGTSTLASVSEQPSQSEQTAHLFWRRAGVLDPHVLAPVANGALDPRGTPPGWTGTADMEQFMKRIYAHIDQQK